MRKTEHYGLNQWDLPDRVRMEDFNADNAKIEAALAALSTRISGLDGQMGGRVTTEALEAVKTQLEKADTELQNKKLEKKSIYFLDQKPFVPAGNNTYALMDASGLELKNFAAFLMYIVLTDKKGDTYYLNPYAGTSTRVGKCISFNGNSDKGMVALKNGAMSSVLFFPMGSTSASAGCLCFGDGFGIGSAICNFASLTGFTLTPASGTLDPNLSVNLTIYGIK